MSDVQGDLENDERTAAKEEDPHSEEEDPYPDDLEVHGRYRDEFSGRLCLLIVSVDIQFVVERRTPRFANARDIYNFYQSCSDLAPGFTYKLQLCLLSTDPRRFFVTLRCDEALYVKVIQYSESERKKIAVSLRSSDDPDLETPRVSQTSSISEEAQTERRSGWIASMLEKGHLIRKCLENEFRILGELPISPADHSLRSPPTPGFELWWNVARLKFDGTWEDL